MMALNIIETCSKYGNFFRRSELLLLIFDEITLPIPHFFQDLVMLPIEQYQKDGRIFRGLRKGAHSFSSSTAMSIFTLTGKAVGAVMFISSLCYDIMSPEANVVLGKRIHPQFGRQG